MDNLKREAEFHNTRAYLESDGGKRLGYVYSSMQDVMGLPADRCPEDANNVLEVGCYLGGNSFKFLNKKYLGIDISSAAIDIATKRKKKSHHKFIVHDANHLQQLESEFDYVFGNGVIHHLDLDAFNNGLNNILSQNGKAVFFEPLQGPFYLRLFRWLTPKMRTEDEHPLKKADLKKFEEVFDIQIDYFGFVRPLMPMILGNLKFAVNLAAFIDRILMKTWLKSQAWIVVITFHRKST